METLTTKIGKYPVYKLKEVGESIKIKDLGLKSVSHSKEYILFIVLQLDY